MPKSASEIVIVGGGLAGLTLGILLRQRAVPVTIWEAGEYPRHRVCGEFISGSGIEVLDRVGLLEEIRRIGGRLAHSTALFAQSGRIIEFELPKPAICISRYRLDALLARRFEAVGGILKTKSRWKDSCAEESVVRATGRRASEPRRRMWRWFGLKVHCRNVSMIADLEMHFRRDGYVGLCRLSDEEINLCGLFRTRDPVPALASEWKEFLAGSQPTALHQKLRGAVYDEDSFCAIAALDPADSQSSIQSEVRIGDALGMIPPVTGNGMSIAFETAYAAKAPLVAYAQGILNWQEAALAIRRENFVQLSRRLRYARMMHPFLFRTSLQNVFCTNRLMGHWLLRKLFELTR